MEVKKAVQRANRLEKAKSEKVLMELWRQAFETGRVSIPFESDCKTEADCIHNSLADFRKKIQKKSLENFELFCIIDKVALKRPSVFEIVLERKPEKFSGRTGMILNLIGRVPELQKLAPDKVEENGIENILNDFKNN